MVKWLTLDEAAEYLRMGRSTFYSPLDSQPSGTCADSLISQPKSHFEMISDAGFTELGSPQRLWEAGIIWARK